MQENSHTKKHHTDVSKGFKIIFWIQILFSLLKDIGLQRIAKGYELKSVTDPGNLSTIFLEMSLEPYCDSFLVCYLNEL